MSHSHHQKQFRQSKRTRKDILGKYCELCLKRPATVGHHTHGKQYNGIFDVQLRCPWCEQVCHQQDKAGNPHWAWSIFQANNLVIAGHLNIEYP